MGEGVGRLVLVWNCPLAGCGKPAQAWIQKSIQVTYHLLQSNRHGFRNLKVSLIVVNNIITYCSQTGMDLEILKCHLL